MKMKRKLELNRQKALLVDLEKMHEKSEISEQTYAEMKRKYEEKLKDLEEHLEDEEEELELELEDLGEDMSELGLRISEKVNSAVARAMDKVHATMSNLPSSFENFETGESYTAEEVFEGSFDTDKVYIDFDTVNGHIELEKWDQDTYKVVATKKVRSYSEERAREKLERIKITFEHEKKDGKDVLKLSPSESGASVSITAYLPGTVKGGMLSKEHPVVYDADVNSVNGHLAVEGIHMGETALKTVNGRIEIGHVHADDLDAESVNGRITLEDTEAEKSSVSTENGRLELDNVRGKTITGSTENGSIRSRISFEDAELKTENGSIKFYPKGKGKYDLQTEMGSISIDVERSMPYHIEARTGMGKVRVASDLDVASKNRHCITVESPTYESAEERLFVDARTDMGSVKIR